VLCGFFSPFSHSPRLPSDALPVPIVRQSTDYSCGAAALLSVLQYWGKYEEPESSLFEPLKTSPKDGTDPNAILSLAKTFGLAARMQEHTTLEGLQTALKQGETPIIDIQAWRGEEVQKPWPDTWEEGHFVVVVGTDRRYVYFMDPVVGSGYTYLPSAELVERWHDYETYNGVPVRNYQLALFLKGDKPLRSFPGPLLPTE
jgi:uncharacterized protein